MIYILYDNQNEKLIVNENFVPLCIFLCIHGEEDKSQKKLL